MSWATWARGILINFKFHAVYKLYPITVQGSVTTNLGSQNWCWTESNKIALFSACINFYISLTKNTGLELHSWRLGRRLPLCAHHCISIEHIYNFLIGCALPRRKCLGALALSKLKHTWLKIEFLYLLFFEPHFCKKTITWCEKCMHIAQGNTQATLPWSWLLLV